MTDPVLRPVQPAQLRQTTKYRHDLTTREEMLLVHGLSDRIRRYEGYARKGIAVESDKDAINEMVVLREKLLKGGELV